MLIDAAAPDPERQPNPTTRSPLTTLVPPLAPEPERTRNAGSAETRVCPPAAAPDSCGARREALLPVKEGVEV